MVFIIGLNHTLGFKFFFVQISSWYFLKTLKYKSQCKNNCQVQALKWNQLLSSEINLDNKKIQALMWEQLSNSKLNLDKKKFNSYVEIVAKFTPQIVFQA